MSVHILQRHLNLLGYEAGEVDGVAGPKTRAACYQFALRALVTPREDTMPRGGVAGSQLSHTPTPDGARRVATPWLRVAQGELDRDVIEVPGSGHNPRILEYQKATTLSAPDDETPWCSSFVCWCLQAVGVAHTADARARSHLAWGEVLPTPRYGCLVIFSRPPNPRAGHVAFWLETTDERVRVLGGNQSNRVSVATFPKSRVLGYRWPKGYRDE